MATTFQHRTRLPAATVLLGVLFCLGCSTQPAVRLEALATDESACLAWYQKLDALLDEHEVTDSSAARLQDFPFLRADRFLASFNTQKLTDAAYADWLERMRQLDAALRLSETKNLPPAAANAVLAEAPVPGAFEQVLKQCGRRLVKAAMQRPEYKPFLRQQIEVPDTYRNWQRLAGAYWLVQYPAKLGLQDLHTRLAASFAQDRHDLPVQGRLIRYAPAASSPLSSGEIATMLRAAYQNPLGIPALAGENQRRLFDHYAPIWEIDTRNDTDRIGEAVLNDRGEPRIDTRHPVVYRKHAYTRLKGRILLQLIYQIWLPAREKTGLTDLYGGDLDSVIWRVTLSPEGVPVTYDSIHACGCYYLLLPGRHYRSIAPTDGAEAVLSPKRIGGIKPEERLLLRLESRTHYLQQTAIIAGSDSTPATRYQILDYDSLLSLPLPDGSRRSLFGPDGIVAASTRPERFLLWPFGVPSPGAMRQWGVHAIAFTGRRYFDDPYLLEHLLADGS